MKRTIVFSLVLALGLPAAAGAVARKGRARGTVRIFGPAAEAPGVTCDSGAVGWRVRRN
jgi:hypothetical protein